MAVKLKNLFKFISTKDASSFYEIEDCTLSGLTEDSREVHRGFAFVALQGETRHGLDFLESVLEKKPALILADRKLTVPEKKLVGHVPFAFHEHLRNLLGYLTAAFYKNPSGSMKVIGVTGTSGKTTVTHLLESIFQTAGYSTGLVGTIQVRYGNKTLDASHTTPSSGALQKLFFEMQMAKTQVVIMEVSSHALEQGRVNGIFFDGMVFTNLSPEHLDYHQTMENYFSAKEKFFQDLRVQSEKFGKTVKTVVNLDDSYGQRLAEQLQLEREQYKKIKQALLLSPDGIKGDLEGNSFSSPLTGSFNLENILHAILMAQAVGIPNATICKGIENLKGVPGRLERIQTPKNISVFVDYAHKPDALQKVLNALRSLARDRLIVVFGCGGNRDRQKRPLMGKIAEKLADIVIVTSDNPRFEDPATIVEEITSGMNKNGNSPVVILDRRTAIYHALELAKAGDFVLIAGKGHETYQEIQGKKQPFDDRKVVLEWLVK